MGCSRDMKYKHLHREVRRVSRAGLIYQSETGVYLGAQQLSMPERSTVLFSPNGALVADGPWLYLRGLRCSFCPRIVHRGQLLDTLAHPSSNTLSG